MAQNPEDKKPNWPAKPNYTSKLPSSSDSGKIPPRTNIKAANGLPHSPSPKALPGFQSK